MLRVPLRFLEILPNFTYQQNSPFQTVCWAMLKFKLLRKHHRLARLTFKWYCQYSGKAFVGKRSLTQIYMLPWIPFQIELGTSHGDSVWFHWRLFSCRKQLSPWSHTIFQPSHCSEYCRYSTSLCRKQNGCTSIQSFHEPPRKAVRRVGPQQPHLVKISEQRCISKADKLYLKNNLRYLQEISLLLPSSFRLEEIDIRKDRQRHIGRQT